MEISMEPYEKRIIWLRDCFTGGYTLPQYCIDKGFRKPLFVAEEKTLRFMWEVYVQFRYDKRMLPTFSVLDLPTDKVMFTIHYTVNSMKFTNFSEINPDDYDAIILLTPATIPVKSKKVISLLKLSRYFIRKTYTEIPVLNFLQRHPKVKVLYTILPNKLARYKGGLEFGESLKRFTGFLSKIKARTGKRVPTPFDQFGYTNQEVETLYRCGANAKANLDGTTVIADDDDPLVRIKDNERATAYQPEKFQNTIYFFGPCHFLGRLAPYDKTIASYLQQLLNEHDLPYRVENKGQLFAGRYQDMFYNLNALAPAPGDIVLLWITSNTHANNIPFLDVSDAFDPPHDYKEYFWKEGHFNELGYKRIAERFFERLTENNFFRDKEFDNTPPPLHRIATASRRNSRLAAQKISATRSWRLTSSNFGRGKCPSAQSS